MSSAITAAITSSAKSCARDNFSPNNTPPNAIANTGATKYPKPLSNTAPVSDAQIKVPQLTATNTAAKACNPISRAPMRRINAENFPNQTKTNNNKTSEKTTRHPTNATGETP